MIGEVRVSKFGARFPLFRAINFICNILSLCFLIPFDKRAVSDTFRFSKLGYMVYTENYRWISDQYRNTNKQAYYIKPACLVSISIGNPPYYFIGHIIYDIKNIAMHYPWHNY